jgi:vitamin B12 transporter
MKCFSLLVAALCAGISLSAQTSPVVALPGLTVYSERVANQSGASTFAAPVSALRYEPGVDIQSRNTAEGQADITLRGGIFENSGFRVGAISLLDPQTGHYLAEVPIAPAMLSAPQIFTGADNAFNSLNANVGTVAHGWRPVPAAGFVSVAAGNYGMNRQEFYQGMASGARWGSRRVAADVAYARSESDGSIEFGDHRFSRVNGRLQLSTLTTQTDVFAGYQEKFFGWPNLYTPFNSKETENLQTVLFAVNHRVNLGKGDFVEAGAHHRRNKDDYAFNRFAPLGPVHPFQHTTKATGAAISSRKTVDAFSYSFRAEGQADDLDSTSLTAGRYRSRRLMKLVFVPERSWTHGNDARIVAKAGVAYDDSNRTGSAWSPVFELARERPTAPIRRTYLSYAKTTQLPNYTILNSSATAGLFRGNPDLGRERSQNLELGASGLFAGWDGRAAVFFRRDDALVDWTFRRGVTARAANAVDIDTAGFEAVARQSWRRFDVVLGYTALTKEADYRGAIVDASFYALNYARHRLTAAFVVRVGNNVEVRMDNVARIQADNLLRQIGGDETLLSSCGIVYRPPALPGCEFSLQADNLWNSNYQEVPAVPAGRRQIAVGATYSW